MQTFKDTIELAQEKLIEYKEDIFSSESTSKKTTGGLEEKMSVGQLSQDISKFEQKVSA